MPTTNPAVLSGIPSQLLPPEVTGPIFVKAVEQSAIMSLGRRVPLAVNAATNIPIPGDVPLADWTDEAAKKPLSTSAVSYKTMTGKKLAVLVPVSEEVARTNSAGLYEQLLNDLPTALARAFDFVAIHGRTLKTGAAGPFADYLASTSAKVVLGTKATTAGGMWADFVTGEQTIVNADYDFTGIVADKRIKPTLKLQVDNNGRPLFLEDPGLGSVGQDPGRSLTGSLIGYPAAFTTAVSGKFRRQSTSTDSGMRAIGGDFSQVAFGVGMDITVKVSDQASYMDEGGVVHSAFQENLVLLLCEAYYGLVISDSNAFVKYVTNAGVTS